MPYELDPFPFINRGLAEPWLDPVMLAFTWLGDGLVLFVVCAAVLAARERRGALRPAAALGAAMLVAGLLVQGLKRLIGAPRPLAYYAAQGALDAVRVVGEPLRAQSFPSGHAAAWGCAAAFLSLRYPKLWPVFAAAALLGGFSRVYVGAHFAIDVAAGWVLGAACGVAAHLVLTRSTRAKA